MLPTPVRSVRGMAATEFILVSVPLLLAGLGAFEAARWNVARQAVSFALLEGARAGAVSHASPQAIEDAFRKGLQPLGASHAARALPDDQLPWRVEVLSPRPAHFTDFPGSNHQGVRTIEHAYQSLQHQRAVNAGLPGGRGPESGDTIFGANTLSLRLTYLHVPLVPGMRSFLRQLGAVLPDAGFAAQAMRTAGALPIRQTVSIAMQSSPREHDHAALTPALGPPGRGVPAQLDPPAQAPPCRGLWCDRPWPGAYEQPAATAPHTALSPPLTAPADSTTLPWDDNKQACQAALCCAEPAG
nr:pilus assembly protein [Pseudomonas sp.]